MWKQQLKYLHIQRLKKEGKYRYYKLEMYFVVQNNALYNFKSVNIVNIVLKILMWSWGIIDFSIFVYQKDYSDKMFLCAAVREASKFELM